jgi:hypothetical protein
VSRIEQLTLRGFDAALERKLREVAKADGTSLNQAVLKLLRRATGIDQSAPNPRAIGASYDDVIGTWSDSEGKEFDDAVAELRVVDEAMWR